MTKKEKVERIAAELGYSESHVSKVLSGSRSNQEIEDLSDEIDAEEDESNFTGKKNTNIAPVTKAVAQQKLNDVFNVGEMKKLKSGQIGNVLKTCREQRGMSQETVGEAIGVSRTTISKVENDSEACSLRVFFAYLQTCGVQVDFRLTFA